MLIINREYMGVPANTEQDASTERNERGVARDVEWLGGRRPPLEPRSGDQLASETSYLSVISNCSGVMPFNSAKRLYRSIKVLAAT